MKNTTTKTRKPRHVLFIPSGSIGDAVMLLALFVEIETHESGTQCTVIARRNATLIADMAKAYPSIHVVPLEKNLRSLLRCGFEVLRRPYSVFMPGAFGKSWFLNTRIVFIVLSWRPGTQTYGLLKKVDDPNPYTVGFVYGPHVLHIDHLRRLARAASFAVEKEGAPISFTFASRRKEDFPYKPGAYVVYHPFGSSSWKSFPQRRSKELLKTLTALYPQLGLVITGGPENKKEAQDIAEAVPGVFVAVGLPILEVTDIIERSALFIGVDTGTLHLACVMQHPVLALEHNASPEWAPTYNPNALVRTTVEHCQCGGTKNDVCLVTEDGREYMRCLYEITDEMIIEDVSKFLPLRS